MAQMDTDACPSAMHGLTALSGPSEIEQTLDAVAREVIEEVKTKTLRLQSRLAEFKRNPNHVTAIHVAVYVIDQDASAQTYRELAERTIDRLTRVVEYAAESFEKIRRVLIAQKN